MEEFQQKKLKISKLEFVSLIYNFLFQIILIFFVSILSLNYATKRGLNRVIIFLLLGYHYSLTIGSSIITYGERSDSNNYFLYTLDASSWFSQFGLSTTFIRFLIYPLIHFFKLNYYSISLIFGSFGVIGFILFYSLLNNISKSKVLYIGGVNVLFLILFLPSFHIWMTSLGKDSLVFMLTMILLNGHIDKSHNIKTYIFLLFILTFIRPYIGVYLLLSFLLVYVLEGVNTSRKLMLVSGIVIGGLIVSFKIFNSLNIDISTFFSKKLQWYSLYSNLKKEGSFIDPMEMNTFQKVFAYLYRPFFYDAKGLGQVIVSFENLFFLILFFKFLLIFKLSVFRKRFDSKLLLVYCILFILINSFLLYNIGLANRQKYMLFPLFVFVLFDLNSRVKNKFVMKL